MRNESHRLVFFPISFWRVDDPDHASNGLVTGCVAFIHPHIESRFSKPRFGMRRNRSMPMARLEEVRLFALGSTRPLGERIARELGVVLSVHEEREFEDGEHKLRPLEEVSGRDVYVIHSLYGEPGQSANDKLCKLLFFVGGLVDAATRTVSVIAPYLAYGRKDRRTKPRDPITTRYIATLLEVIGTDRIVTLEVHNPAAFENAFRCPKEHVVPDRLFVDSLAGVLGQRPVAVVSPDIGGAKRAARFKAVLANRLGGEVATVFMEKYRSEGAVRSGVLVGHVAGADAVIVDDLVSTGTTLSRAVAACREAGAERVFAVAAHGLFTEDAGRVLAQAPIDRLWITDSVPPFRLTPEVVRAKVSTVSTAGLFADVIRRNRVA
jgi:ribose-phosphate pyrophosphokinase